MAPDATTRAAAEAAAKVQSLARKAGHACNSHDARFIGYALDEAIARRRHVKDVKMEYGALRVRFDLYDDGGISVEEEKDDDGERTSAGQPRKGGQRAPPQPPEPQPQPVVLHDDAAVEPTGPFIDAEKEDLRKRVTTLAEKKKRQKKNRKAREEAKREQASNYVAQQYGADGAPQLDVFVPLWSTKVDLKMAFTKLLGEVSHRCAIRSREPDAPRTRGTSARFGGVPFTVSVLDGTVAQTMSAAELAVDLLVLLDNGLTEERLATLLRRWSKARARGSAASSAMADE